MNKKMEKKILPAVLVVASIALNVALVGLV